MKATIERQCLTWHITLSDGRYLIIYEQQGEFVIDTTPSGSKVISVPGLCDLGLVVTQIKHMVGKEKVTYSM